MPQVVLLDADDPVAGFGECRIPPGIGRLVEQGAVVQVAVDLDDETPSPVEIVDSAHPAFAADVPLTDEGIKTGPLGDDLKTPSSC